MEIECLLIPLTRPSRMNLCSAFLAIIASLEHRLTGNSTSIGISDSHGLMDAMKGYGNKREELMKKTSMGQFTFRELYDQHEKKLNIGHCSCVVF